MKVSVNAGIGRLLLTAFVSVLAVIFLRDELGLFGLGALFAATVYGLSLAVGRPRALLLPLPQLIADAMVVSLVVTVTGAGTSPFVWLYTLVPLGLARSSWAGTSWRTIALAMFIVVASFLTVVLSGDGRLRQAVSTIGVEPYEAFNAIRDNLADEFELTIYAFLIGLVILSLIVWLLGYDRRYLALDAAQWRNNSVEAREEAWLNLALARRFSDGLDVLGEYKILAIAAQAAVEDLGASYAHVEHYGRGGNPSGPRSGVGQSYIGEGFEDLGHALVDDESFHRLLAQSATVKEPVCAEVDLADVTQITAAPILDQDGANIGAIVLSHGPMQETGLRVLRSLAAYTGPLLESVVEAPGGREPITGLPNRASLRRTLARNMNKERRVRVLVAQLAGLEYVEHEFGSSAAEAALQQIAGSLSRGYTEAWSFGDDRFAVVIREGRGATWRQAEWLQRVVTDGLAKVEEKWLKESNRQPESNGQVIAGSGGYDCYVGFAEAEAPFSPEQLLADCEFALEVARTNQESISGPGLVGGNRPVHSLMLAVDSMDPALASHMRGVADLSRRIGEQLNLERTCLENVELGALLHDIAKMNLPLYVRDREPEDLDEDESNPLKEVPLDGEKMLRERLGESLHEDVYSTVLYHGERYDGSGYLGVYAGEEIPLPARIVRVADAMDMTLRSFSISPSRERQVGIERLLRTGTGESLWRVSDMLSSGAGHSFDPDVAEAAQAVLDEATDALRSGGR